MPWDEAYYPLSMGKLPLEVRLKAIRIAIAKAKEWADRRE
jgi:uncharacterized protein YdaT